MAFGFMKSQPGGSAATSRSRSSTKGILRFSHNGRLLAWVMITTRIHVLDVRTGGSSGPFTGHDDAITGLAFTIDDQALASSSGDCTILIWDVSAQTVRERHLPGGNSDDDWQALRGRTLRRRSRPSARLAGRPEAALKIAVEQLKPAEAIDPQWVAARLRDLDNPKFAEREQATRDLEEVGDRAVAALEKFMAARPSAEASGRAEKLLARRRDQAATGKASTIPARARSAGMDRHGEGKRAGREPGEGGRRGVTDRGSKTESEKMEGLRGVAVPVRTGRCQKPGKPDDSNRAGDPRPKSGPVGVRVGRTDVVRSPSESSPRP